MNYDEAFSYSTKWIKSYYEQKNDTRIDYDDYYQNCAVDFYKLKKQGFSVEDCLNLETVGYIEIYKDMLDEVNKKDATEIHFVEDFYNVGTKIEWKYSVPLTQDLQIICNLIVDGYNNNEICSIIHCRIEYLNKCVEEIKKLYKKYWGTNLDEKITTI